MKRKRREDVFCCCCVCVGGGGGEGVGGTVEIKKKTKNTKVFDPSLSHEKVGVRAARNGKSKKAARSLTCSPLQSLPRTRKEEKGEKRGIPKKKNTNTLTKRNK